MLVGGRAGKHDDLRLLDLFSGIGGFSLGLERTGGFKTVAFCEIEPFCQRVLRKHWPDVPIYDDVRALTADALSRDGIGVDVICGGFPCQDISEAGTRAGLAGERSGLWKDFARLIGELRPCYAIVENVSALLYRGLGDVLGDLAAIGYDAEWQAISASAIGAPHVRDRVWIIAHPNGCDLRTPWPTTAEGRAASIFDHGAIEAARLEAWGDVVSDMGSAVYGLPGTVDALRPLGNAVVPQIPELIGRATLAAENRTT